MSNRQEGQRSVQRRMDFYNLDAIISVGYRVKSAVATRFRIWATQSEKTALLGPQSSNLPDANVAICPLCGEQFVRLSEHNQTHLQGTNGRIDKAQSDATIERNQTRHESLRTILVSPPPPCKGSG